MVAVVLVLVLLMVGCLLSYCIVARAGMVASRLYVCGLRGITCAPCGRVGRAVHGLVLAYRKRVLQGAT